MYTLERQIMRPGFEVASLRGQVPMGHVLNIDFFTMSQPTFAPHPHAGFSAVTWMLPWSRGAFVNRDSLGDRSRIEPGALHWARAGAGLVHEELPAQIGVASLGLQIFVKLPREHEHGPAQVFHLEPSAIPTARVGAAAIQILAGELAGVRSAIPSASATTIAHVTVRGGAARLEAPPERPGFALGLRGRGRVDGAAIRADQVTALVGDAVELDSDGELDLLLAWSPPLPAPARFRGPFCFFDDASLDDAARRYRAGDMGDLASRQD
jgi:redox-sensitive bicupin YhaK (pirin superfamily)